MAGTLCNTLLLQHGCVVLWQEQQDSVHHLPVQREVSAWDTEPWHARVCVGMARP